MTKSGEGTSRSILSICFLVLLLVKGGAMLTEYADKECDGTIQIWSSGGILKSQFMFTYENKMDCTVTLSTNFDRKILLTFDSMDIKGDPSDCESSDYLEVFDGTTKETSLGVFCGSTTPSPITSSSNSITLTLKTDSFDIGDGYRLAYTSFTESSDAPCMSTEFECKNGRCISYHLKDNDDDNCGDKSDIGSMTNTTSTSPGDDISIDWFMSLFSILLQWGTGVLVAIIIGIIVIIILLCVCCGCICYHCCCKKRQQPQYTGVAQQPAIAMQPTGQQYDKPAQI